MIRLYVGKSASGKNFLMERDLSKGYIPIVSATTRPMRKGEVQGKDYNFVSDAAFRDMEEAGEFMETRKYITMVKGKEDIWCYGAPAIEDPMRGNYVAIVDVDGAKEFIDYYGAKAIEVCFVTADKETRKERAMKRGSFDETEWERRAKDDDIKFSDNQINSLKRMCGSYRTISNNKDNTVERKKERFYVISNNSECDDLSIWEATSYKEAAELIRYDMARAINNDGSNMGGINFDLDSPYVCFSDYHIDWRIVEENLMEKAGPKLSELKGDRALKDIYKAIENEDMDSINSILERNEYEDFLNLDDYL